MNVQEAQFKSGGITLDKFLNTQFHEKIKEKKLDLCLTSVTFAVFKIDSLGNVGSLTFSENKNTPAIFREVLTAVINSTNGLWSPCKINGKSVVSKPFVLPLIYEMEAACKAGETSASNGTSNALLGFLDFSNGSVGKVNQLDCVLLSPLHIFSIK